MKENCQKIGINTDSKEELITKDELTTSLIALRDDWLRDYGSRSYSREDGRSQWYVAIAVNLSNAQDENIIPESVKEEVDRFLNWYTGPFKNKSQYPVINKSSEISRTETIINHVLESLGVDTKNIDPKKDIIRKFLGLRYDHCEEIPEKIVHSTDGMYKIRTDWFLGIACDLEYVLDEGFLSEDVLDDADDFLNWWVNHYGKDEIYKKVYIPGLGNATVNTQADIDRGNKILDIVLKDLGFEQKNITTEAGVPITTREKTIEHMIFMRDTYSDKIPRKILHSFDINSDFKVKRGWFSGLNAHLENAIRSSILTEAAVEEINKYFEWHSTEFCNKKDKNRLTTKEDILKANEIINVVLKDLGFEQKT